MVAKTLTSHCQALESLVPVCFNQPLNLLGLSLNSDVCLEFPERFIQLHGREVHFIHNTADKNRSVTNMFTSDDENPFLRFFTKHRGWIINQALF